MTRWLFVDAGLVAARAAGFAVATSAASSAILARMLFDGIALVRCLMIALLVAPGQHCIVSEGVIARVAVANFVFFVLRQLLVLRNRYFAQITRVGLVFITMRAVPNYVFVICMILIRCHNIVIMILWLLRRMLMFLIVAFIVRLSVMMFSLLFSFVIVIASTMIKMGMIMSLLPLHRTAIRWALVYGVIVRAIHHRLWAERSEAGIVECCGGGLLGVRAVREGVVAVAQSVKDRRRKSFSINSRFS